MRWLLTSPMVAFDTETTGVDVEQDRIITAAVIALRPIRAGQPWQIQPQTWLINPGIAIPAEATAAHGITTEAAAQGAPPDKALDAIATQLAGRLASRWPIVGFNLAYDLTLLDRELRRHHLPDLEQRIAYPLLCIDPYVIDKQVDPYRKGSRKLADMAAHYGVALADAHDATADATAAARIAYRIAQLATGAQPDCPATRGGNVPTGYGELAALGKAELHTAQIGWRAAQSASFADYLRRKGQPADDVDGQWPMRAWKEPA